MEINKLDNKICIFKTLSDDEEYKIINKKDFKSISFYKKPEWVAGYSSMCKDYQHILLMDYDNCAYWFLKEELNLFIQKYKLTNVYIFVSNEETINNELIGNYHIVCLKKYSTSDISTILSGSHCDYAFQTMPLRKPFKCWVLRLSGKGSRTSPKFKECLISSFNNEQISTAHYELLIKFFDIPKFEYKNQDNFSEIFLHNYQTANRLTKIA